MSHREPAGLSGLQSAARVLARPAYGPRADDGSLLRLAAWLAEVSAEAGQAAATQTLAPGRNETWAPPTAEPTR